MIVKKRTTFQGFTASGLFEKIQSLMGVLECELQWYSDIIIFMSKYNDIGFRKEIKKDVNTIH